MRCRHRDRRYTLVIRSGEEMQYGRVQMIIAKSRWSPAADVYETEEQLYINIELAGIDSQKIDISLYENALVVEGQRQIKPVTSNCLYHMAEIQQGPFCFELPLFFPVESEKVDIQYEDGILSIILNKQVAKP